MAVHEQSSKVSLTTFVKRTPDRLNVLESIDSNRAGHDHTVTFLETAPLLLNILVGVLADSVVGDQPPGLVGDRQG